MGRGCLVQGEGVSGLGGVSGPGGCLVQGGVSDAGGLWTDRCL